MNFWMICADVLVKADVLKYVNFSWVRYDAQCGPITRYEAIKTSECFLFKLAFNILARFDHTTHQSMMNAKSNQIVWRYHENRLFKAIQKLPHNLYASLKLAALYCRTRLILVSPIGSWLDTHFYVVGIALIVLMSPFSWQLPKPMLTGIGIHQKNVEL